MPRRVDAVKRETQIQVYLVLERPIVPPTLNLTRRFHF